MGRERREREHWGRGLVFNAQSTVSCPGEQERERKKDGEKIFDGVHWWLVVWLAG